MCSDYPIHIESVCGTSLPAFSYIQYFKNIFISFHCVVQSLNIQVQRNLLHTTKFQAAALRASALDQRKTFKNGEKNKTETTLQTEP